jgi:DNA-binding response OmpR family regulator
MNSFQDARVALMEADETVRRHTRSALKAIGFSNIESVSDLDGLDRAQQSKRHDLLVFGVAGGDREVVRHVHGLRRENWPNDPFAPILLTGSGLSRGSVVMALHAGPDQILLYPFSPSQMGERISGLLSQRKEFVETLDYIGPDRRGGRRSVTDGITVPVPNALKAAVERCGDFAPSPEAISAARKSLQTGKLVNLGRRIAAHAKAVQKSATPNSEGRIDNDRLNDLWASSVEFSLLSEELRVDRLLPYGQAVERVVRDIAEGPRIVGDDTLRLLVKAALALLTVAENTAPQMLAENG